MKQKGIKNINKSEALAILEEKTIKNPDYIRQIEEVSQRLNLPVETVNFFVYEYLKDGALYLQKESYSKRRILRIMSDFIEIIIIQTKNKKNINL